MEWCLIIFTYNREIHLCYAFKEVKPIHVGHVEIRYDDVEPIWIL